jgi:hypothetical protein
MLLAVLPGETQSMASTDKALGRLSDWTTLAMLAGIAALPPLIEHKIDQRPRAVAPRVIARSAPAPAPTASAPAPASAHVTPPPAAPAATPPAAPVPDVWTEAEQAAGLRECLRLLAPVAAEVTLEEPMKHGQCGTSAPLVLHSIGSAAKVEFSPAPTMNCRLAAQLARWIDAVLQPAAREVLGARVTRIVGASSYSCRNIYNKPNLPLSQHATGSAVDIAGFVTADGRSISVAKGWGPTERDIVAAQEKAAKAAKADAKSKDQKEPAEGSAAADEGTAEKSRDGEAKVHKAGFKAERASVVAAAAIGVTAAKTSEAAFLKRLHHGACSVFGTVLGPEANDAHRDHFHLDVKERKGPGVCH